MSLHDLDGLCTVIQYRHLFVELVAHFPGDEAERNVPIKYGKHRATRAVSLVRFCEPKKAQDAYITRAIRAWVFPDADKPPCEDGNSGARISVRQSRSLAHTARDRARYGRGSNGSVRRNRNTPMHKARMNNWLA